MNSIESMEKYKNDFTVRFAQLMQENLPQWKEIQEQERLSLISRSSFGVYFLLALFGFMPGKGEHNYNLKLHCCFALILFIAGIVGNIKITNKAYQNKIKKSLFPKLLKTFGDIHYGYSAEEIEETIKHPNA